MYDIIFVYYVLFASSNNILILFFHFFLFICSKNIAKCAYFDIILTTNSMPDAAAQISSHFSASARLKNALDRIG